MKKNEESKAISRIVSTLLKRSRTATFQSLDHYHKKRLECFQSKHSSFRLKTLQFLYRNTPVFVSKHSSVCTETLECLNRTL